MSGLSRAVGESRWLKECQIPGPCRLSAGKLAQCVSELVTVPGAVGVDARCAGPAAVCALVHPPGLPAAFRAWNALWEAIHLWPINNAIKLTARLIPWPRFLNDSYPSPPPRALPRVWDVARALLRRHRRIKTWVVDGKTAFFQLRNPAGLQTLLRLWDGQRWVVMTRLPMGATFLSGRYASCHVRRLRDPPWCVGTTRRYRHLLHRWGDYGRAACG